jgi:hypothetical protein
MWVHVSHRHDLPGNVILSRAEQREAQSKDQTRVAEAQRAANRVTSESIRKSDRVWSFDCAHFVRFAQDDG